MHIWIYAHMQAYKHTKHAQNNTQQKQSKIKFLPQQIYTSHRHKQYLKTQMNIQTPALNSNVILDHISYICSTEIKVENMTNP